MSAKEITMVNFAGGLIKSKTGTERKSEIPAYGYFSSGNRTEKYRNDLSKQRKS